MQKAHPSAMQRPSTWRPGPSTLPAIRPRPRTGRTRTATILLVCVCCAACYFALLLLGKLWIRAFWTPPHETPEQPEAAGAVSGGPNRPPPAVATAAATLVLYSFSNTDPQYFGNLLFFIKHGIPGCDTCDYIITINEGASSPGVPLPPLPRNARYLHHVNQCYDWGTFGWVLKTQDVDIGRYEYFIFLNSSVRGPFLPPYLKGRVHFTEAMTGALVGDVKMAGPTINCEGTDAPDGGERRNNPHVQSFAVATDAVGMALLVRDGKVFGCYETMKETVYYSELGASRAILEAGYNLGSFMGRYQGVDWRDRRMWACNDGENPFNYARVDSITLAPMELMFVKVKHNMLLLNYPSALAAVAYDDWLNHTAAGRPAVTVSIMAERLWEFRAPFILEMAAVGLDCFDCPFYLKNNPELQNLTCWEAFTEFINQGQFRMRSHQFTCDPSLLDKAVPYAPVNDGLPWPRPATWGCSRATLPLPTQPPLHPPP